MVTSPEQALRAWIEYLRELGIHEFHHRAEPRVLLGEAGREQLQRAPALTAPAQATPVKPRVAQRSVPLSGAIPGTPSGVGGREFVRTDQSYAAAVPPGRPSQVSAPKTSVAAQPPSLLQEPEALPALPPELAPPMPKPQPIEALFAAAAPVAPADRRAALEGLRAEIGDCTRCPLAYAGRHSIVFGEGDPAARLMFVGEGPGADEDASGRPFVGKAGQLLGNMIAAMGLRREDVFIANVVKCRPPGNRAPEYVEATTCSQFLLRQIDIVRPEVIVALGSTAATYLLGLRQTLSSLRGQWHQVRSSKVTVTFHPAYLLRDPRQKSEAWKDLQRVMAELGLRPPTSPKP